jgi:hypothetical protein
MGSIKKADGSSLLYALVTVYDKAIAERIQGIVEGAFLCPVDIYVAGEGTYSKPTYYLVLADIPQIKTYDQIALYTKGVKDGMMVNDDTSTWYKYEEIYSEIYGSGK